MFARDGEVSRCLPGGLDHRRRRRQTGPFLRQAALVVEEVGLHEGTATANCSMCACTFAIANARESLQHAVSHAHGGYHSRGSLGRPRSGS